ncbi:MAG: PKD domain-containing protein [Chitinophagaceae bacterium]
MKRLILLIFFLVIGKCVLAIHVKGGWIYYKYIGAGNTNDTSVYQVTVYVFKDCNINGPLPVGLAVYDANTNAVVSTIIPTPYTNTGNTTKATFDPCLSNPPRICYQIQTFTTTLRLANNANGYIIACQDAYRTAGIINLVNSSSNGISFTANIPGRINGTDYHVNTSPIFAFKDTAVVCYSSKFSYPYSATDEDGDSLSYSFGDAISGRPSLTAPPYNSMVYATGFSGTKPLGNDVTINPTSGLITGIAPPTIGEYVIAVYVHEWRNRVLINSTRKELQITVANCTSSVADLKTSYINCDNFFFTFQNESPASNIESYLWDFGVANSTTDTSSSPTPSFTYPAAGTYELKLKVSNKGGCSDSTTSLVSVYPGFRPNFSFIGSCFQTPFNFIDQSTFNQLDAGVTWKWNFGDLNTLDDTSNIQNPSYKYTQANNVLVSLLVTSSRGCSRQINLPVAIKSKPTINLPFNDTLICSIDSLMLVSQSSSNATYNWTPNTNILNANSSNPIVFPKDTTIYTVTVTENSCVDSAKVTVNVLDFITVKIQPDTNLCKNDSIVLRPISDALSYKWTSSTATNYLSDSTIKNPIAFPNQSVLYTVIANLGLCQDKANIQVNVSPYPLVQLGNDTTICFGNRVQLKPLQFSGSLFTWNPTNSLVNINTKEPLAGPIKTTAYSITVSDTLFCPKKASDTILVKIIQPFNVFAGNDTTITYNQNLQLNAISNGSDLSYLWQPTTFLSNNSIANPILNINNYNKDTIHYTVTASTKEGCFATDNIVVKAFKLSPDIIIPTGFTPNRDGKNDLLKPILIGIAKLNYFSIYNRWGQLVFTTNTAEKGWDGTFNGQIQSTDTYVIIAQGIDYLGKPIYKKTTSVLIR